LLNIGRVSIRMETRGLAGIVFAVSFFICLFLFLPLIAKICQRLGIYGIPEQVSWEDIITKPKTLAIAFLASLIVATIITAVIGYVVGIAWGRRR